MNQRAEKCKLCSVNDLPCGPYETAEETREFLKTVAHLHTIDGQSTQRTAASFNYDDRQPTASEPQSQNALSPNAPFLPHNSASNSGFHHNQLPTTPHASQEIVDNSLSGIGPTPINFNSSSDLHEASFDVFDSFTNSYADLEDVEHLYDHAPSSEIGEDESAVLSV